MKFTTATVIATALLFGQANAHGGVIGYFINNVWEQGFKAYNTATGQVTAQRQWATYNPITTVSDPNLACNDPGTPTSPTQSWSIGAGSKIQANWNNPWPHTVGPLMVYMAKCPGTCSSWTPGSSKVWFKIDQSGLLSGTVANGNWGQGKMVSQNSSWTSTIPSCIPAGNHLIRHELLAIHTSNQPQFYPECAQLTVTGGGSKSPSNLLAFPGSYSASDPSINIDVYSSTATTYTVPGGAVFTC